MRAHSIDKQRGSAPSPALSWQDLTDTALSKAYGKGEGRPAAGHSIGSKEEGYVWDVFYLNAEHALR